MYSTYQQKALGCSFWVRVGLEWMSTVCWGRQRCSKVRWAGHSVLRSLKWPQNRSVLDFHRFSRFSLSRRIPVSICLFSTFRALNPVQMLAPSLLQQVQKRLFCVGFTLDYFEQDSIVSASNQNNNTWMKQERSWENWTTTTLDADNDDSHVDVSGGLRSFRRRPLPIK